MFKEVSVVQVREVLRRWLSGNDGLRRVADAAGVDRKTARRYVEAAESLGVKRNGGEPQLTEEVLAAVVDKVRPGRPAGHGGAWELLGSHHEKLKELVVVKGLTVVKAGDLLARQGLVVPERTLHRYCAEHFPGNAERGTVRLADPEPGKELQADFGKMGLLFDPVQARRRVVHALVLVAVLSRHMFVWLTFTQTTEDVIEGLENAWEFFKGIFAVLVPDNLKPVITKAEPTEPRINDTFLEYSQDRGFLIDAARVRHPRDKARCERQVPYVRSRFFAGEDFVDLSDANRRAVSWCLDEAGGRVHGTTRCKPLEAFMALEQPVLIPTPEERYDTPHTAEPKVHPDHHVEVLRALYTIPGDDMVGKTVSARVDSKTAKFYYKGQLIKVHPRKAPGGRSTDPADLPKERTAYAMRDIESLVARGHAANAAVGTYIEALMATKLPWTKMRQAYRLLALVDKWGAERVGAACTTALEAEVVNVNLIARMLEKAKEKEGPGTAGTAPNGKAGRFARDKAEFEARGRAK
jgi:transposase